MCNLLETSELIRKHGFTLQFMTAVEFEIAYLSKSRRRLCSVVLRDSDGHITLVLPSVPTLMFKLVQASVGGSLDSEVD